MRFLDVGSAASLVNYHLYRWESCYFGVDISLQLVKSMNRFVRSSNIVIGGLAAGELAALPFANDSFDIAAVIGVLEYCTPQYVSEALSELHRTLRPGSRTVLDIPNEDSPLVDTMFHLEDSLGRRAIRHSRIDFERCLEPRFCVERCDEEHVMLQYFCRVVK
jgi:SAM-dependent methyltransferase